MADLVSERVAPRVSYRTDIALGTGVGLWAPLPAGSRCRGLSEVSSSWVKIPVKGRSPTVIPSYRRWSLGLRVCTLVRTMCTNVAQFMCSAVGLSNASI